MFRAICETGGVAGINFYTSFVSQNNPTVDDLCDHVFHFLELDPDGTHIALGGDLDGCDSLPGGIQGIQDYVKLSDRLLQRGLTEDMVYNIFWKNALEVMKRALHNNKR
jgi:membrane dipeptidase